MADPMSVAQRLPPNPLTLNISDVLDVLSQVDPSMSVYGDAPMMGSSTGAAPSEPAYSTISAPTRPDPEQEAKRKAYVRIIEQPQPKALRFRYQCEGRSAGSIPGVNSTTETKTFPTIQVMNYKGPAVVVVSCVTVDAPYRPHPHNLVGREGCTKGVCTMPINTDTMQCSFSNLGVQCVKKKDVEGALQTREEIRVDPFQTGFSHRSQNQSIDLNAIRLCFQVFLEGSEKGKYTYSLKPVVSEPILDKKAAANLMICKLSDCTSSVAGGKEIILLCDKVTKEDIQVRFFEVKDGVTEWEAFGDFQASDVHKQVAISFKTPRYKTLEIENPVKVYVELRRITDKCSSHPRPFQYLPLDSGRPFTSFKRLKNSYGLFQRILGLDSPVGGSGEEALRHKAPHSPRGEGFLESITADDAKPSTVAKVPVAARPAGARSPPLLAPPKASPPSLSPLPIYPSQAAPPGQSIDDIKQRLTATLDKRRSGGLSPKVGVGQPKPSPFWSDDTSVYSDNDMLDDVLSQGSVNDLLSAVGDGFAVYEDITGIPEPANNNAIAGDAVYGDPSYASCYSNLEFVMGQARAAGTTLPLPAKLDELPPSLPPKKNPRSSVVQIDDDFGEYGTPSGQPVHPNKASLLLERGFRHGNVTGGSAAKDAAPLFIDSSGNIAAPLGTASECDDLDDMWDESSSQSQERPCEQLPRSVLDLFV